MEEVATEPVPVPASLVAAPSDAAPVLAVPRTSPAQAVSGDLFKVVGVTEPHEQGGGMSKFVAYKVNSQRNLPEGGEASPFMVTRRYSDFEWLRQQLNQHFAFVVVPPLPGKQATGNLDPVFIEYRRAALEKFMRRTCRHAILQHSAALQMFCEADDQTFNQKKKQMIPQPDAAPEAPKVGWFGRAKAAISNVTTTVAPDLDEPCVYEHQAQFNKVSLQLQATRKATERMMFKQLEMAQAYSELGVQLQQHAAQEVDTLGPTLKLVGISEQQMAKEFEKHAGMMAQLLDEPLQDHISMMGAASDLCSSRHQVALKLTNARNDTQRKEVEVEKAKGTKNEASLAKELETFTGVQEAAQGRFDKFTENFTKEVEHFHAHRVTDMKAIMKIYVDAACQLSNTVSAKRATLAQNLTDPERALAEIAPKEKENVTAEQQ